MIENFYDKYSIKFYIFQTLVNQYLKYYSIIKIDYLKNKVYDA